MTFTLLKTMLSQTVSASAPSPSGRLGGARFEIYDVNGRMVYEDKVADVANKNYELILDIKSGIYFVEVIDTATNTYYKQKLVIQK